MGAQLFLSLLTAPFQTIYVNLQINGHYGKINQKQMDLKVFEDV